MEHSLLIKIAVLLAAAAVAAPLAKKLKIGAVLGYLIAGLIIGPYGLKIFTEAEQILHIAEFGVVLLLFLIGLELRPQRLWAMRNSVFGIGSAQVALTSLALLLLLVIAGKSWREATFIGLALALSSTAFVIQVLQEKNELGKPHGRLGFSVLLFQDLAAIPMIAFVGLFSIGGDQGEPMTLTGAATAVAAITLVVIAGHYLLNPLYKLASATGIKEAMPASALMTVVIAALLMEIAGLSAGLGAFIAGAMLADSEYRHEIQADIAPFEGLLLGTFFVAIGMVLNLELLSSQPLTVMSYLAVLVITKLVILWGLAKWHGLSTPSARRFALVMAQGGEFAFVLAAAGHKVGAIFLPAAEMISVVVTLSMLVTPFLLMLDDLILSRTARTGTPEEKTFDEMPEDSGHIIIAGLGRFGQITARVLAARKIPFTALDMDADQVAVVRRYGGRVFYGDASRLDILRAAQAGEAAAIVICMSNVEMSVKTVKIIRRHFPHVPVYARARDRHHVHRLMDEGVENIMRETFLSALELSRRVLLAAGLSRNEAAETIKAFAETDRNRLHDDYRHATDQEKLAESARKQAQELADLFESDRETIKED